MTIVIGLVNIGFGAYLLQQGYGAETHDWLVFGLMHFGMGMFILAASGSSQ